MLYKVILTPRALLSEMSKRTASTREKEERQGESKNDLELNVN